MLSISQYLSTIQYPSDIKNSFKPYMYTLPKFKRGPDVIIAGAMKAGTTSLYHWLAQYKNKVSPFRHRINTTGRGLNHAFSEAKFLHLKENVCNKELRQLYLAGWRKDHNGIRIEKSPIYLVDAVATAAHIKFMCPEVKVICLFRHPIKRFESHLNHRLRDYALPVGSGNKIVLNSTDELRSWNFGSIKYQNTTQERYFNRSFYAESFRMFRQALSPSQVHPVIFERMIKSDSREQVLRDVSNFVGLEYQNYDFRKKNGTKDQITVELTEEFKRELHGIFDKDVKLLKEYLNDDIPEWNW